MEPTRAHPRVDDLGLKVDLGRVVHTVTKALDYVGVDDKSHGRRVGLICHRAAHMLGWTRDQRHVALIAGMLHDCGVSSTAVHQKLIASLEWDGAEEHCLRGEFFLSCFPPLARYAGYIRHHHTRWNQFAPEVDATTRDVANLIFLADRLDVLHVGFLFEHPAHDALLYKETFLDPLWLHAGSLFNPALLKAMQQAAQKDSFWLELQDEFLDAAIFETLADGDYRITLDFSDIIALGEFLSAIVDAKSAFTHQHSLRVADLVHALAGTLGYGERDRQLLRLAGLLHDVGKLRTPDAVLEKEGPLCTEEKHLMHRHPLDSKIVLQSLFPGTPLPRWVSQHHEKLNGQGYPYGWSGEQIDRETRLLTICDIFQALSQNRPYRGRLPVEQIIGIMAGMRDAGEIDPEIFRVLTANQDEMYRIAIRD